MGASWRAAPSPLVAGLTRCSLIPLPSDVLRTTVRERRAALVAAEAALSEAEKRADEGEGGSTSLPDYGKKEGGEPRRPALSKRATHMTGFSLSG